jgi:hypothetical protein
MFAAGASVVGAADGSPAGAPHGSVHCPMCKAAAHGRTAFGALSTQTLRLSTSTLALAWFAHAQLPAARMRSKAEPRAPPA